MQPKQNLKAGKVYDQKVMVISDLVVQKAMIDSRYRAMTCYNYEDPRHYMSDCPS
jgi:hypothetical protein